MTTETRTDTIAVCVDCVHLAEYGDSGIEAEVAKDFHAFKVASTWPDGFEIVTNGDVGESFSWRPCEGCGSRLGGARFEAEVTS